MGGNDGAKPLVIGSRGSRLALWQAGHVAELLPCESMVKVIKTSGDRFLDQALQRRNDKGFFTKEIEEELIAGTVDLAVHSLKDLPTLLPDGLMLGAVTKRAGVSDLLIVRPGAIDAANPLPVKTGGRLGATSLRRQALLRRYAPMYDPAMLRGNVPTRVDKLRRGDYDAIIIARAGVDRLGLDLSGLSVFELNPAVWLPAPGQGVLGIEIRKGDAQTASALVKLNDSRVRGAAGIERELLSRFEGGCHTAFGSWAELGEGRITLRLGREDDGGRWFAAVVTGEREEEIIELAYEKLKRVVSSGNEEDSFGDWLYREI